MHIHILGICGTFMAGFAQIAKAMGHTVSGCDANVYPPMSDQLRNAGIDIINGYGPEQLEIKPDLWVIGNAISRGNPLLEAVLNARLPYTSAPQWLEENLLDRVKVLAVAGTHGKTTTSSMLTWILEYNGKNPNFLIGGVPSNFEHSARYTGSEWFVIEADEYDTAFFDKRSKFVHYRPYVAILNNLEYDHADIFPDVAAIERQFHHMVRIVPQVGTLVVNAHCETLDEVLEMGCWTPVEYFGTEGASKDWALGEGEEPPVYYKGRAVGVMSIPLPGHHNRMNALAAVAAAHAAGVSPEDALEAMKAFNGVKRRLEFKGEVRGVRVVDDFAHHPTAIEETLKAQRAAQDSGRILVVFEPRSNTMKMGAMKNRLPESFALADKVFSYQGPSVTWNVEEVMCSIGEHSEVFRDLDEIATAVAREARAGDTVLVMSNGGFGGIQNKILAELAKVP